MFVEKDYHRLSKDVAIGEDFGEIVKIEKVDCEKIRIFFENWVIVCQSWDCGGGVSSCSLKFYKKVSHSEALALKYVACNCGLEVVRYYISPHNYTEPVQISGVEETYDKVGNVTCPKCGEIIGDCDWLGL